MAADRSLALLIEYWLSNNSDMSTREFTILLLETVRDDLSHATVGGGSPVTDVRQVREYLEEQVAALRDARKYNVEINAEKQERP